MKKIINICVVLIVSVVLLNSCGTMAPTTTTTKNITINSEPTGAKVLLDGKVICESTPCIVPIVLVEQSSQAGKDMTHKKFTFLKNGYENEEEVLKPQLTPIGGNLYGSRYIYPDAVFHIFKKKGQIPLEDPTIRIGEATNMVSRDNPGGTALERTIIRWNFDSDPRGSRLFWRVISSVPDQVKNTNETYLTSTPYEETRSFNILGLTYENSRDVTIEIKVTKKGYMDQVKRYNVRQAIDQQEISGFFELVKE